MKVMRMMIKKEPSTKPLGIYFLLLLLVLSVMLSLMENQLEVERTDMVLSMVSTHSDTIYNDVVADNIFRCIVENEEHCEFIYLRNFLTRTHLQDLIETTAQIHYEAFRAKQLLAIKESTQPASSQASINTNQNPTLPNSPNTMASPTSFASNALTSPGAVSSTMGSPAQSTKSVPAFG